MTAALAAASGAAATPEGAAAPTGDLPRLFSCGYPPRGGALTTSAHAFYVLGVGRR